MKNASRLSPLAVAIVLVAAVAGPASAQTYANSRTVRCESVESREVTCRIPAGQVAEFVEQNSRAECVRGRTYFIEYDAIIVTRGCRATFRVFDAPYSGGGLRSELRSRLAVELGRMIRNDHNLGSSPSVEIIDDSERADGRDRVAYQGSARVERNGNYWNNVTFDASYDLRTRAFTRIDYDLSGAGDSDRMDAALEAALERALADEVRRQKGGGVVQVAVNYRHRSTRSGGTNTITGRFGYSWNDADWVTRGFEAQANPSGQQVRNVRIFRTGQ